MSLNLAGTIYAILGARSWLSHLFFTSRPENRATFSRTRLKAAKALGLWSSEGDCELAFTK